MTSRAGPCRQREFPSARALVGQQRCCAWLVAVLVRFLRYVDFGYTNADVRLDAAWPGGYAPEDHMPPEIRRAKRLRSRESGYRLAESLIAHGVPVEVAALLMAVSHQEQSEQRQWTVRVDEARLAGDVGVCSMPVHGCREHGDTLK